MAGREVVNRQVNIYIQSGEAQKAYDALIRKEKQLNDELAKTTDPKRMKKLRDDLKALEEPIGRAAKKLSGELAPSLKDVEAAARKARQELSRMSQNDPGFAAKVKQYNEFNAQLGAMRMEIGHLNAAQQSLGKTNFFTASFWANLAANGVAKVGGALSNFFSTAISEALDADESTQRLKSTLDNLGRGDAFDRITKKADEMAEKFRYLDNDDIVGVFNKLIDYGRLTEKEMNNLLPVIIDFAAKSKMGIDESADVIIKALEGNGKALKQYGIDLKDTGTEADRLEKIMGVLGPKVQGAGEAFQNSAKGGIMTARQELKNLAEEIGSVLIPILNTLLGWVLKAINGVKKFFKDIRDGFKGAFEINAIGNARARAEKAFEESLKSSVGEAVTAIQNQLKVDASTDDLGLADKIIGGKKTVAEKKKEVDEMINAFQRMLEIRQKIDIELGKNASSSQMEERFKQEDAFIKRMQGFTSPSGIDSGKSNKAFEADRLARLELNVLKSRGREKLKAEQEILDEKKRKELDNAELTSNQIKLIEERYRKEREKAEKDYFLGLVEAIASYANQALSIISTFNTAKANEENAELDRDRRINDKKLQNLERRLASGKITQAQYNKEAEKLQNDLEKKEKDIQLRQWQRQKRASIVQAIINGAEGATKTIANLGFPAAIPALIAQAAVIISQIRLINSQKPQFARGGQLGGALHSEGGNPILDGKTGRKIAEIEKGEGIINRHSMADRSNYTVSGTPSQIASMLNAIGGGVQWAGGARLVPGWYNSRPASFNYGAIKRYYATGGTFGSTTSSGSAGFDDGNVIAALQDVQSTNAELIAVLRNGIVAYASLQQFNDQQDRLNNIEGERTMR